MFDDLQPGQIKSAGTGKTAYKTVSGDLKTYDYSNPNRKDKRRNGNKSGERKGWQVAEMWDKHHEIARLLILGHNNQEIAKMVNCSSQQVSNVKNSPVVKDKCAILRAVRDTESIDLRKEIAALAPLAVQRMKEALEEGSVLGKDLTGANILKEANNMLDRELGKATQTLETKNAHVHFTKDDIEAIKEKARALAMDSDQIANF